jgi:hypothetical protein
VIALRAHHLLCQFGYRGHGYSEAFVDNMTAVLDHLSQHSHTLVRLSDEPDVLCAKYPTDQPNHCCQPEVIERDRRILAQLDLHRGTTMPWSDLVERAKTRFVPDDLTQLCSTCPWLPLGYCQQGLQQASLHPG